MSDTIRSAVHAQVEQKIDAGEALESAIGAEREAQARLDDAARATTNARQKALRSGWSESELRSLGLLSTKSKRSAARRGTKTTTEPSPQPFNQD